MKTAAMDEIMSQRDPELKAAAEASLAGDVKKAFVKLRSNVAEVNADNLAGAARWFKLSPAERQNAGLMAPSHALREEINAIVRECLIRDGNVKGPTMETERLISRGYTNSAKSLPANYAPSNVVVFHRDYKRFSVEKGDELRVAGVDHEARAVRLEGKDGQSVLWEPDRLAARSGGVEVYKVEQMELRQGDRIRWTRNDTDLGLVNSQVAGVKDGAVTFKLEDGRSLDMREGDPQLCHIDRAWAFTVHDFQGRTVDTVIAAMEANHPTGASQEPGGRTGSGPEHRPGKRCIRIAGAGTDAGAGNREGPAAEGHRSRSRPVAAIFGEREMDFLHPGQTGLIFIAQAPRLSATPLAVSSAGRGASSEALAFCGDE